MSDILNYSESPIKQKKRQLIIEKTMDIFIRDGIYVPTMQDIANENNISLRTLYYYYSSKEDLAVDIQIVSMKKLIDLISTYEFNPNITAYENLTLALQNFYYVLMNEQKVIKYITAFDYYFFNQYPNKKYNEILSKINVHPVIVQIVELNQIDQSIHTYDSTFDSLITTVFQSLLSYGQKIIYREKVMLSEDISNRGELDLFIKIILEGLKKR